MAGAVAVAVAVAMVAGCNRGDDKPRKASLATSTSTTSTTVIAGPPSPLTGLPTDPEKLARPLLVVKIDNAEAARPQAGLDEAEVVVVEKVEGGSTRFAALFHAADADPVGPVRSARSTDVRLATAFNRPLFAYSGANAVFRALVARSVLVDVGIDKYPKDYVRAAGRRAPHDLFTSTKKLFGHSPKSPKAPPVLFAFRTAGSPTTAAGAAPAGTVEVNYGITRSSWTWDPSGREWVRTQNGSPHVDAAGKRVTAKNVVVQFVRYTNTGLVDASRAPVPEAQLVGSGEAWVLTDGKVVKGKWSKPGLGQVTVYTDPAGTQVALEPGSTWVELPDPGGAVVGR